MQEKCIKNSKNRIDSSTQETIIHTMQNRSSKNYESTIDSLS